MSENDRAGIIATILIGTALALFAFHTTRFGRYLADDAGISFAYAKNLARGNGLVLNPGSDPVEGYSNFLWVLALLPFCARGTDPTAGVKLLSVALGAASLVTVAAIGLRIAAESRDHRCVCIGAAGAVGLAAFTPYVVWASAGLENGLYCALFVGALHLYLKQSFAGCAGLLLALSLTRVEGAAIAALFALHRAAFLLRHRQRPSPRDLTAASNFVAGYGAYTTWHRLHFRAPVPNSCYLAKSAALNAGRAADVAHPIAQGWAYAEGQLLDPYHFAAAAPFATIGLVGLRRGTRAPFAMLFAGVVALVLLTGGDIYPEFRLGTLVLPLWFLLVVEGARRLAALTRVRALAPIAAALPLAAMCVPSLGVAAAWNDPIGFMMLKPITADRFAEFAGRIATRPATVMESDIGNVAYFTDYAIVDLAALNTLAIARYGSDASMFLHYVFEEIKPDIIHLRDRFAVQANIPVALIERDYRSVEGRPTKAFAEGWWMLRDEVARTAPRRCASGQSRCEDPARAWTPVAEAEAYRRGSRFTEAFAAYSSAWDADPRNVVALRGREDMRPLAARSCAGPPAAPDRLSFSREESMVTLRWNAPLRLGTSYVVEAGSSSGMNDLAVLTSAAPMITAPTVPGRPHWVRVKAGNACGISVRQARLS